MTDRVLEVQLIGGDHHGKLAFIPRITVIPSSKSTGFSFALRRRQFPVRLAFAITINKAQGQSVKRVGLDLRVPAFSHGQLYVALSRGVSRETTRILAKPNKEVDKSGKSTKNIVYRDILER